jgi:hypothetical protein
MAFDVHVTTVVPAHDHPLAVKLLNVYPLGKLSITVTVDPSVAPAAVAELFAT